MNTGAATVPSAAPNRPALTYRKSEKPALTSGEYFVYWCQEAAHAHTTIMAVVSRPFSGVPADAPPELVVEMLDPVITNAHARIHSLGDTMSRGSEKTRRAMVAVLESNGQEVAVAALLTGTNALMLGYRAVLEPVGASLRAQVDTAQTAWRTYCATGNWEPPVRTAPPAVPIPQPLIQTASPRLLTESEHITAEYTESVLGTTANVATSIGQAGNDFFANALRAPIPAGELMDFVDTTATEHAKVFAILQRALAASLYDYITVTQSSYQTYKQTCHWANPVVVFT